MFMHTVAVCWWLKASLACIMHPWVKGIQVCSNEGLCLFPRGDNFEIATIHWRIWTILSSTAKPVWIKLGTMHPWVKGIQFCSNEGLCPFSKGNNFEIAKIHRRICKILFSRTTGLISIKLGTNHLWVKGIQVYSNEGPLLFPRVDITNIENKLTILKHLFLQNHFANNNWIWHKSSLGENYISLFKWRVTHFPRGANSKKIWTTGPIQPNLAMSNPGWRGFKLVQMERTHLFTLGDNNKLQKYIHEIIKSCSLELLDQFYNIYMHRFSQIYSSIWIGFSGERCGPWILVLIIWSFFVKLWVTFTQRCLKVKFRWNWLNGSRDVYF